MRVLFHDFVHGFYHVDHGLLFTAKQLLLRPGPMIKDYLLGHRVSYYNPFTFILLIGGINAILLKQFHWQSLFVDLGIFKAGSVDQSLWNSSIKHFSFRLLAAIPLYALISYLFYFRKGYNFFEHIVASTYLRGQGSVYMLLLAPLSLLFPHSTIYIAGTKLVFYFLILVYVGWAYAGWFEKKITFGGLLKGFLCALISSMLEVYALGLFILK